MLIKSKHWIIISLILVFALSLPVYAGEVQDIKGHWANEQIENWLDKGLIKGYGDGKYRPERNVTRAEFVALINNAFGYTAKASYGFDDVKGSDWFADEIAKAKAVGYVAGYSNGYFKPNNSISRQEAAVIICNILKLDTAKYQSVLAGLSDSGTIPGWSKDKVNAAVSLGFMAGYPDKTFRQDKPITRAEVVATLDKVVGELYNTTQVFGPETGTQNIKGNATISKSGITLKNTVIEGNLYLTEGIGTGNVTLDNVTVKGLTIVSGGGINSIIAINSSLGMVVIEVPDGTKVRLVASGSTSISSVEARSNTKLEEDTLTGSGFGDVLVYIPAGADMELKGDFGTVQVETSNTKISLTEGKIEELNLGDQAAGASVNIASGAVVQSLNVDTNASITGKGVIEKANISAPGVTVETKPVSTTVAPGYTAVIGGTTVTGTTLPGNISTGSGGSSIPTYILAGVANPSAGGTVTGAGNYRKDAAITLTAIPNEGYEFVNWTLNGVLVSTDVSFQYTMPAENKTISANFILEGSIPVATAEDLNSIRNNLEGHYVQVADIDLGSTPYNEGEGWEPIGEFIYQDWEVIDNSFKGIFDGNGFKVSNLMINRPNEDYITVGLFGSCSEDAQLSNVTLENVNVTGTWAVGGLVGESYGSIIGSSVTGAVYGYESVGGLAGYNEGSVTDSYATCLVIGEGESNYSIGGLVGGNYGTIINSYATGLVVGESEAGGLAGSNGGSIAGSYATGSITGQYQVGGLVGANNGSITDSYAAGTVTGQDEVGGLVGGNWYTDISTSYATGSVVGESAVGGLVGYDYHGTITSSYAVNLGLQRASGSTADTFGRIVGGYSSTTLTKNFASSDIEEPFTDAFSDKTHSGKDGANLYSWQIGPDGGITAVAEKTIYALDIALPDNMIVATKEADLAVTVAKDFPGYSGYDNVRLNVSADGGTVQLPTGWETGFAIGPDYDTTADISVLYSTGGNYTLTLSLVDLDNEEQILASKSIPVKVAYAVASATDLNNVRNNLNAAYVQVEDIDLEGINWIPLGTYAQPFKGKYNGNGFKISNLTINNLPDPSMDYGVGLFGHVNDGNLENIVLKNVSVTGKSAVGGLVGSLTGTIMNSHVEGTVTGALSTGGLVGSNWEGTIEECSASGFVNGTGTGYKESIGGLVGRNKGIIARSFAAVEVYSEGYCNGGLVGFNGGGTISKSYAIGDVTATTSWTGGLVGDNRMFNELPSSISKCYAIGQVTGGIGGLVGLNDGGGGTSLGTVEMSYYDSDTTTMTDDEGKGTPKTTVEMKQQATFTDWDFDDTWVIDEEISYPYLKWQVIN